jgi:transcription factor IIIB subunit 2
MSRDWMITGRRPSGLCGAAILIAARIHGYKRTVKQIVSVVNVCDEVIRRRLEEFSNSPMCRMTLNEFESCDMQDDGRGNDPPAFVRNRKKEKELEKKQKEMERLKEKAKEIEKIMEGNDNTDTMTMTVVNNNMTVDTTNATHLNVNSYKDETFEENSRRLIAMTVIDEQKDKVLISTTEKMVVTTPVKERRSPIESDHKQKEDDEYLSDLEEKDASFYILSSEEYKLKKILWEVLFKDWIEEQKDKKENEKMKSVKKRPRNMSKSEIISNNTPAEAIINSNKFSKKLNISVLNKLFSKEK